MSQVKLKDYLQAAKTIKQKYSVVYDWGSSGVKYQSGQNSDGVAIYKYKCDCRGYAILWCLRLCGLKISCPGTNYSIRKQMATLHKVKSVSDLNVGEVVYKVRDSSSSSYNLPSSYKKGNALYNSTVGELDSYHIGVVIQTSPSLIIYHCSTGGIRTDTSLGKWSYAGYLSYIDVDGTTEQTTTTQQSEQTIKTVIGGNLNLRKAPDKTATRLKLIPNNSNVTVLKQKCGTDGWNYVNYNGISGYVMSKFLS